MTDKTRTVPVAKQSEYGSIWANEDEAKFLRRRVENFWNSDYLERVVLPLLELPSRAQVCDVGSGYGGLTLPLARLSPESLFIGVDLEPKAVREALKVAEGMGLTNVGFREGDACALPFEADTFDAVCCQTLLTHLQEPLKALHEMVRILKPGRCLLVVEYCHGGVFSMHDDVVVEEDIATQLERFRFSQLYIEGKRRLARGDDTIGIRIPFMLQDMGLEICDVRKNDRAWHAFPPYAKENERVALAVTRDFAEPTGEAMRARIAENIRAGGGSDADVKRYFELADDAERKRQIRERIDSGMYSYVGSFPFYLTFARKPGEKPTATAP